MNPDPQIGWQGGAYTFSDGSSILHVDFMSGWDEKQLQKLLDECKNDGQSARRDLWCENHLSFRDLPKMKPKYKEDPDVDAARTVQILTNIQPKPALDPRKTVCAEAITGVAALPKGACSVPLIEANPNTDWRCTRNCTYIGASTGNRGGTCSDVTKTKVAVAGIKNEMKKYVRPYICCIFATISFVFAPSDRFKANGKGNN